MDWLVVKVFVGTNATIPVPIPRFLPVRDKIVFGGYS